MAKSKAKKQRLRLERENMRNPEKSRNMSVGTYVRRTKTKQEKMEKDARKHRQGFSSRSGRDSFFLLFSPKTIPTSFDATKKGRFRILSPYRSP